MVISIFTLRHNHHLRWIALGLFFGLCVLWLNTGLFTPALAKSEKPVSLPAIEATANSEPIGPTPTQNDSAVSAEASEAETAMAQLLSKIQTLSWQPMPSDARKISLKGALEDALQKSLDIQIGEERIKETEAKENTIEGKRLLFFFKFFNFQHIEGAAESDVLAAKEALAAEEHKTLLETTEAYTNLMRAVMQHYIAYQAIQQGLKQLQLNEQQFQSGETTNIELTQTKTQLITLYQHWLTANLVQHSASLRIQGLLGLEENRPLYPTALVFENEAFVLKQHDLIPITLTPEQCKILAWTYRPEIKELTFKLESLEDLVKVNFNQFDKHQVAQMKATIAQAKLSLNKAKRLLGIQAVEAQEKLQLAAIKVQLTEQQLQLAKIALHQIQISHQAGFSSNKDVLDTQVSFAQAQVNDVNARLDHRLAQVQLLYELGLIANDTITNAGTAAKHIDNAWQQLLKNESAHSHKSEHSKAL